MATDPSKGSGKEAAAPTAGGAPGQKRFIRTFESDMQALKSVGTVDREQKKEEAQPEAPPRPKSAPAPVLPPKPVPKRTLSAPDDGIAYDETPGSADDAYLLTQQKRKDDEVVVPSAEELSQVLEAPHGPLPPPPAPPPKQAPPPPERPARPQKPKPKPKAKPAKPAKPDKPQSSPLETYGGDFADRVKDTKAAPLTVLAAEQDAGRSAVKETEAPRTDVRKNVLYALAGVLLLLIGAGAAFFAYGYYAHKPQPVVVQPSASTPIFVDEQQTVSGTGSALARAIIASSKKDLGFNKVRLLTLTGTSTSDESVFSALELPAPGVLLRNIDAKGSMAGIVNVSGTQTPFFILAVSSYGDTFAGMLDWEPRMAADLSTLFPPYGTGGAVAASSSTSTVPTRASGFVDEVVANHDARAYRDQNGKTAVIYGYWNQGTLVIARDEAAFSALVGRLANSRS